MKLAVAGKGGVGKTTVSAGMVKRFAKAGYTVYAVDADPDACLGMALGLPEDRLASLLPVIEMREEIAQKTGGGGAFYSLNPPVDDFLQKYTVISDNVRFFRMGGVKQGGSSCYCRENTFLHALVDNLFLDQKDAVVMDMGAGIEHLTRGTTKGVDVIIVVTEPSRVSVNTAQTVIKLAQDLGVKRIGVVANKVRNEKEKAFVHSQFPSNDVLGFLPYDEGILEVAMGLSGAAGENLEVELDRIFEKLLALK